jgi:hypothetical protein
MRIEELTPLQASALREAHHSPTHALVRQGKQYSAQHPRESTSGIKRVPTFTYRLVAMLERLWLLEFDEPQFPTRATLTRKGIALAEQLVAGDEAKAGAA